MKSTATTLLLAAALLAAAPSVGNAANFFSLHVGGDHFGLVVGASDWAMYRDSWYDQRWAPDYDATLAGYGEWVWVSGLGRVWRPWVAAAWRPYTHGRWVCSDLGWTWVSFEPWGYLPHHYGEWAYTTYGWTWVPGYSYHPAKVVWVHDGGWLGWYPQAPRGWSHSHRAFHAGYDRGYDRGYWNGWNDARHATWVEWKNLGSENLSHHAVDSRSLRNRGARTPGIMANPPSRNDLRRHGARVEQTVMEQRRVTVAGRSMTMARPKGMTEVVQRQAAPTVQRALSAEVGARAPRAGASHPSSGVSPRRSAATVESRATVSRAQGNGTAVDSRPARVDRSETTVRPRAHDTARRAPTTASSMQRPTSESRADQRGAATLHRPAAKPETSTTSNARSSASRGQSATRTVAAPRTSAAARSGGQRAETRREAGQAQVKRGETQHDDRSRATASGRRSNNAEAQKRAEKARRR